jgi:hypothetical protein
VPHALNERISRTERSEPIGGFRLVIGRFRQNGTRRISGNFWSWNPCRNWIGGNEALVEEEEEANDEPNEGDFFRLIVSFSAFL